MEALATVGKALPPRSFAAWRVDGDQAQRPSAEERVHPLNPLAGVMHAVLQRVLIGICVVDRQLNLVYANDAARKEIRASAGIAVRDLKLQVGSDAAHAKLRKAVEDALMGRWALLDLGAEVGAPQISVVPLGEPGYALLVFGMKPQSHELAISFFIQAHGMTVAEGNVLRGLAEGLSPKQIATHRGVALSTIRSQIRRLRERTRTQHIRELVQAVSRLPPVMPAGLAAS